MNTTHASPAVESFMLRELLARIHGDGGHYLEQYGLERATEEAHDLVATWRAELSRPLEVAAPVTPEELQAFRRTYMGTNGGFSDEAMLTAMRQLLASRVPVASVAVESDLEWMRLPEIMGKFIDYYNEPTDASALRIIRACADRFTPAAPAAPVPAGGEPIVQVSKALIQLDTIYRGLIDAEDETPRPAWLRDSLRIAEQFATQPPTPQDAAPAVAGEAMRKHVEDFATRAGWKREDGEGAFEYVQRISYAQGWENAKAAVVQPTPAKEQVAEDARRYRFAIAKNDNAEALYAAVLNNSPDIAAINEEFDEEILASEKAGSAGNGGGV